MKERQPQGSHGGSENSKSLAANGANARESEKRGKLARFHGSIYFSSPDSRQFVQIRGKALALGPYFCDVAASAGIGLTSGHGPRVYLWNLQPVGIALRMRKILRLLPVATRRSAV
jgi:hypothetical protein